MGMPPSFHTPTLELHSSSIFSSSVSLGAWHQVVKENREREERKRVEEEPGLSNPPQLYNSMEPTLFLGNYQVILW